MMPIIEVCVYCSRKIEEKEEIRQPSGRGCPPRLCPQGNDPNKGISEGTIVEFRL